MAHNNYRFSNILPSRDLVFDTNSLTYSQKTAIIDGLWKK